MRWITLAFVWVAFIFNFADKSIIGFAAQPIMKEFNLSYIEWGLVTSCFFWLFPVSGVIGGHISDRIGTKKMLGVLVAAWTVLQFGTLAIYGLAAIIAYRILLGIFEGPFAGVYHSHLSKWFPPGFRATAISIANSGASTGGLLFAPFFIYGITNYGWRITCAALGAVTMVWVVLWFFIGKEKPEIPVAPEEEHHESMKWSEIIFKVVLSRTSLLTLLAGFSAFWLTSWIQTWMPTYLSKVLVLSPTEVGLAAVAVGAGGIALQLSLATFSDYIFRRTNSYRKSRTIFGGFVLIGAATSLLLSVYVLKGTWGILGLVLAQGFSQCIFGLNPTILIKLNPEHKGFMATLGPATQNVAGIIAPMFTGFIVQLSDKSAIVGLQYSLAFSATLLFVVGLLFMTLAKPDEAIGRKYSNNVSS